MGPARRLPSRARRSGNQLILRRSSERRSSSSSSCPILNNPAYTDPNIGGYPAGCYTAIIVIASSPRWPSPRSCSPARDLAGLWVAGAGAMTGIVAAFVSAPIAAYVFGGVTGSGVDVIVAALRQGGADVFSARRSARACSATRSTRRSRASSSSSSSSACRRGSSRGSRTASASVGTDRRPTADPWRDRPERRVHRRRRSPTSSAGRRPAPIAPQPATKLVIAFAPGRDRVRRPRAGPGRSSMLGDGARDRGRSPASDGRWCRSSLATIPLVASILLINTFFLPGRHGHARHASGRSARPGPGSRPPSRRRCGSSAFALSVAVFSLTTPTDDLARRSRAARPRPARRCSSIGAAIGTIPRMAERAVEITDSQRARGLDTQGSPVAPGPRACAARRADDHQRPVRGRGADDGARGARVLRARPPDHPPALPDSPGQRVVRWGSLASARSSSSAASLAGCLPPALSSPMSLAARRRATPTPAAAKPVLEAIDLDGRRRPTWSGSWAPTMPASDAVPRRGRPGARRRSAAGSTGSVDARRRRDGDAQAARGGAAVRDPVPEPGQRSCRARAATVWEEIAFGPRNLGLPVGEVVERVEAAMATLRIAATSPSAIRSGCRAARRSWSPSASVLALRPTLLVLDEPTSQLDPAGTRLVGDALARLAASRAPAVLLVEHKTGLVARLARRVVVLDGGRVAARWARRRRRSADPRPRRAAGVDPPPAGMRLDGAAVDGPPRPAADRPCRARVGTAAPLDSAPSADERRRPSLLEGVELRVSRAGRGRSTASTCEIASGERVAIVGQNGSGKSTLVRQLNGLLRPTDGPGAASTGRPIGGRHVAELARQVGLAFQNPDRQIFAGTRPARGGVRAAQPRPARRGARRGCRARRSRRSG